MALAASTTTFLSSKPSIPNFTITSAANPRIAVAVRASSIKSRHVVAFSARNLNPSLSSSSSLSRLFSALGDASATMSTVGGEDAAESATEVQKLEKLYVWNLPWSFKASDIRELFGQCGTVKNVEMIVQKNGKSRGYAFVTMDSVMEASAAVDKFDSYKALDRIITVTYAKSLKKPSPPTPPALPAQASRDRDTQYVIYASNLSWKVRSNNLREFFSSSFKPVSARVVFDSPTGKSSGYGFVSFSTEEEAITVISELNGKELMGRPLRLKISEKKSNDEAPNGMDAEKSQLTL